MCVMVYVDPAYPSEQCSERSYVDRNNPTGLATFACRACGVTAHADMWSEPRAPVKGEAGLDERR